MFQEIKKNKDVIYKKTEANCAICYQEHLCNILEFMKDFYPVLSANQKDRLDDIFPGICKEIDAKDINLLVFSGLLVAQRHHTLYAFDLSKAPSRSTSDSISEPENVFGSRDGFVENYKENIALIRTRVKEDKLDIDSIIIGRRSKTNVSVLSIKDIHNEEIRKGLIRELSKIDIDAILSIEDLMAYFQKNHLFPSYHYIGNPDIACRKLYNGEFLIVVDRICCVISLPTTLAYTSRLKIDGINLPIFSIFERLFVFSSIFFSIFFCAFLLAFATYQSNSLSLTILSTLKVSQKGTYLPVFIQILIILGMFELYYLIGFRQSKMTVSSTIVLIGGLIIGQNMISSGLTGVLLMTMTAIAFLLTFVVSSNVTTILAISILRLALLFSSLFYGIIGVTICGIYIVYRLYHQKTLGVPYFYPFLPFNVRGLHKFFLATSSLKINHRNEPLKVRNKHKRKMQS